MSPRRRSVLAAAGATLLYGGLGGCSLLREPSRIKMDLLYDDRACPATQAPVLLVLLPGAFMSPQELVEQGFVAAVRERGLAVDVAIANAHIGYAQDGSIGQRLHEDVILPARAWGYRRIWLAGISLGGFVALAYEVSFPGTIEGIFAIAPYLGRRTLLDRIVAAGGPAAWARQTPADETDIDARVWRWLAAPPPRAPQVWLGVGREDRFADSHRVLAALLPADRVAVVPGDHDWPPWRTLWAQWLDRGLLPRTCTASAA
jgi:pimeloyl-ACP methyl ester carboxylesterase